MPPTQTTAKAAPAAKAPAVTGRPKTGLSTPATTVAAGSSKATIKGGKETLTPKTSTKTAPDVQPAKIATTGDGDASQSQPKTVEKYSGYIPPPGIYVTMGQVLTRRYVALLEYQQSQEKRQATLEKTGDQPTGKEDNPNPPPAWVTKEGQLPELFKMVVDVYTRAIEDTPTLHDAYIELGAFLEHHSPAPQGLEQAVDVYTRFPFPQTTEATQDDLYIHTEIVRALMLLKRYKDPALVGSMVAAARVVGIGAMSKWVEELDGAGQSRVLMEVYAGANRKGVDDPEMVAFFKSRYWM
ncbi:uncharacterized protein EV422DRAFT_508940 [Fimicolochytrium jonesii]|uniref:uncharacterized protein n=1 Tax=Fimicolochytrium jonesii TaxID=1396493 RepID=UPI0022FF36AD|nr:uncharacterized protein EV422DRAFT_508940 [Fimicolochytrium jonesii]KAI8817338.1 hypothetical protein EV422DRAFT_508940 [Fimicolochytrium jonesii]